MALCLTGDAQLVQSRAREVNARFRNARVQHLKMQDCADFFAGELTDQVLLRRMGDNVYDQCIAHGAIAFLRLAEGDRVAAREHFAAAVATDAFLFWEYCLARAHLKRMHADDTWPAWCRPNAPVRPDPLMDGQLRELTR